MRPFIVWNEKYGSWFKSYSEEAKKFNIILYKLGKRIISLSSLRWYRLSIRDKKYTRNYFIKLPSYREKEYQFEKTFAERILEIINEEYEIGINSLRSDIFAYQINGMIVVRTKNPSVLFKIIPIDFLEYQESTRAIYCILKGGDYQTNIERCIKEQRFDIRNVPECAKIFIDYLKDEDVLNFINYQWGASLNLYNRRLLSILKNEDLPLYINHKWGALEGEFERRITPTL